MTSNDKENWGYVTPLSEGSSWVKQWSLLYSWTSVVQYGSLQITYLQITSTLGLNLSTNHAATLYIAKIGLIFEILWSTANGKYLLYFSFKLHHTIYFHFLWRNKQSTSQCCRLEKTEPKQITFIIIEFLLLSIYIFWF